ncbi:MAG: right-handed parallel beta-helix repeat-containing protein [Planctomycetes bacterium]|nr:right-handed parallel beta-helix repeat-containing protein [Planctomycetota bacterium]
MIRVVAVLAVALVSPARGGEATVPGEVTTPYPTLVHLAVEWEIEGDANANGQVTLRYREVGNAAWREGMPLRRVLPGSNGGFRWANKHSGSIFGLRPDTEYEIALTLRDPDGGSAEKAVRAKTRPVPRAMVDAPIKKVNPETFPDAAAAAKPGDVLLLASGDYGKFNALLDGAPGQPIVLRSPGQPVFNDISLKGRKHVHLEGLTVNGTIDLLDTTECAVRRCEVNAPPGGFGITARARPGEDKAGATNAYIADNVVTGDNPWTKEAMGAKGKNHGEGILISGPGNVVCFNRVVGFRDCISTAEGRAAWEQVCVDVYNNDIERGVDDAIEADYTLSNCRVVRNRITNSFCGLSSQPSLGGPSYFIRNVMYNIIYAPYKLHKRTQGNVVLHNTVVKTGDGSMAFTEQPAQYTLPNGELNRQVIISHALFRNNISIGGTGSGKFGPQYTNGTGLAARWPTADATCDFDYNGYGTHGTPFRGDIMGNSFDSLASLRSNTTEKHAVQVDMDIFAAKVDFPDPPIPSREPADLRLRAGAVAVDSGVVIPNINDSYAGNAPDLGACEFGAELPQYGPRPAGVDEGTAAQ